MLQCLNIRKGGINYEKIFKISTSYALFCWGSAVLARFHINDFKLMKIKCFSFSNIESNHKILVINMREGMKL
ncbi:hypothetical protein BU036_12695 [Staphylococcus simulans]|nr:hypothetical protein AL483_12000 [Staphylococcus simulans]OFJ74614.1 hypothetical protein HMPREF2846_01505 [Staphylococcus sp. HMSC056G08]ATF30229.1 hypothetical protein CO689_04865 [Staphylococcus simulans]AVO01212.1 hypothetical protein BI282_01850 [Staphylococcus simulans]AVO04164.1 hypothetical protein BI283_01850 [Staphylococcus simulans]